jgi:ubiquinone/menaquinone biosynthesis methyltransferase
MRGMFRTIALRYDFISRVLSYGMDQRWKNTAISKASLPKNAIFLDLASGTGDFSEIALSRSPGARSIAVDLTDRMLEIARERGLREVVCADACLLPFADQTFDAVLVGYGLRNFGNLRLAVREIERVTRPGGMMVSLDFFLPENTVLRHSYLAYLYVVGALWGTVLHGRPRTYTYISDSVRTFLSIKQLSSLLHEMGYTQVVSQSHVFGGIGVHWASKL